MYTVFILADQHDAAYAGCYGGMTRTPNIDSLAKDGIVFENAYTPSPMCAPARSCLFSNKYVHENRSWDNCFPYDGERNPGWGHCFRAQGIPVDTIGKLDFMDQRDNGVGHMFHPYLRTSYDVTSLFRKPPLLLRPKYNMVNNWDVKVRESGESIDEPVVRETRRWLDEDRPFDRDWILNVNFEKPHSPWHALPDKYNYYRDKIELSERYLQPESELNPVDIAQSRQTCGFILSNEQLKDCHAAYHAMVEEHDGLVGEILEMLKERGIYDDALIIYSSDHGEMLRAHGAFEKSSLYEDSVHIPLIIKLPGQDKKGTRVSTNASLMDIFPTIADVMGLEPMKEGHGLSLIPYIEDSTKKHPPVLSQSHANGRITGTFMLADDEWRLLHYEDYGDLLFNLKTDPEQMHDLLRDPTAKSEEMYRKMSAALAELVDTKKATEEAFSDQEALKSQMAKTGQLQIELNKRGYDYRDGELFYLPW